ncbi:tripartite tricarboxylate transporter TctB family protein [Denitromonas sp.]|uniref:tripartite tricarboxylate transporter TctB family protein n=1 Tax=Denitromonas sp. TaxID=2734609 RepID=UPI003A8AA844
MISDTGRGGPSRPDFQALTCGILLVGALGALYVLNAQIQVFGFGDAGPSARSFPRVALWVLAAAVVIRLAQSLRRPDVAFGSLRQIGGVLIVTLSTAAALWSMPRFGFFGGAAVAGIVATLAMGERRPSLLIGLPLLVAAIVAYGGRHGLSIPLP